MIFASIWIDEDRKATLSIKSYLIAIILTFDSKQKYV